MSGASGGSSEKFGIRLSLDGADAFEQGLRRAGEAGQQAMSRIAEGARSAGDTTDRATGRIQALSTVFQSGAGAISDFNQRLGQGQSALGALIEKGAGLLAIFGPAGAIAGAALGFAAVQLGLNATRASVEDLTRTASQSAGEFSAYVATLTAYGQGARTAANEVLQLRAAIGQLSEAQQAAEQVRLEQQARQAQERVSQAREALAGVVQAERPQDVNIVPSGWDRALTLAARALGQLNVDFERSRANANALQDSLGQLVGEFRVGNTVWLLSAETQRTLARTLEEARAATNSDDIARLIERLNALAQQGGTTGEAAGRLRDSMFPVLDAMRQFEQANERAQAALRRTGEETDSQTGRFLALRAAAIAAANGTAQVEADLGRAGRLNDAFRLGGRAGLEAQQRDDRVEDAVRRARDSATAGERRAIQDAATARGGARLSDADLAAELANPDRQLRIAGVAQRARDVERDTIAREDASRGGGGGGGGRGNDREERELERLQQQVRSLNGSLDQATRIQQQYEDGQNTLNQALERGVITQEQYDQTLQQLTSRRDTDLERIRTQTDEYRRAAQAAEQDSKALGSALSNAFEAAVLKGGKLSDVLKGLEQDLLRLLTRRLITQPLTDALTGALGGGAGGGAGIGGLISGAAGYIAGLFHGGGEVGQQTAMQRAVSPAYFDHAPRYHVGGIAGMVPGEVPAILKMGERVRTPEQELDMAARIRGMRGGAGGVVVNINATDTGSFIRSKAQVSRQIMGAVRAGQRNS